MIELANVAVFYDVKYFTDTLILIMNRALVN
jgi:hypothetical protein